jgi:hypothetical protein
MALIFERIQTDGIGELSYMFGDDSEGIAAVIDPRADVDCYRASIATSILKQEGFGSVCNVPGSWQAWKHAGCPRRSRTGMP